MNVITDWYRHGAAIGAVLVVGVPTAGAVSTQSGESPLVSDTVRRAIVTGDGALLQLPTEVVCGPKVEAVEVSPRQNYALIVRRTTYPARDAAEFFERGKAENDEAAQLQEPGSPEVQVLLWGPRSRRALTVWRQAIGPTVGYASVDRVQWLPGTDTALIHIIIVRGPLTPEQIKQARTSDDNPPENPSFCVLTP